MLDSEKGIIHERPRRLRRTPTLRRMVRETRLAVDALIYPLFILEGQDLCQPIEAMPGLFQYSPDEQLMVHLAEVDAAGIHQVLLFGIPDPAVKDASGSAAWNPEGPVQQAIRLIRRYYPHWIVFADICLCEFTDHGHCGLVRDHQILNDETLPLLAQAALSCAEAGADGVAPSDMMDGRIGYLRTELDQAGFTDCLIMAYSAKFASAFYGPFREAAGSAPAFGDRRSYQMDPANRREALREVRLDLAEGADIVMVKPALAYLDILRETADLSDRPVAAYHVSGEYSMIKAAAARGWIDEKQVVLESLIASRRAGADLQISYHAPQVARWLAEETGR
jgi:porphobilinogen synthase